MYTKVQQEKIQRRLKSLSKIEKVCLFLKIMKISYKFPTGDFAGRYYININWWNPLTWIMLSLAYIIRLGWEIILLNISIFKESKKTISGSL